MRSHHFIIWEPCLSCIQESFDGSEITGHASNLSRIWKFLNNMQNVFETIGRLRKLTSALMSTLNIFSSSWGVPKSRERFLSNLFLLFEELKKKKEKKEKKDFKVRMVPRLSGWFLEGMVRRWRTPSDEGLLRTLLKERCVTWSCTNSFVISTTHHHGHFWKRVWRPEDGGVDQNWVCNSGTHALKGEQSYCT